MRKFKLYSRPSIFIFSLLLTGFGGALMLSFNLRAIGKQKIIAPLIIITLIADGILFQLAKGFVMNSLLRFIIPNLIAAVILSYPVWDTYLTIDTDDFEEKAVWTPLIVVMVLYGGLFAANMIIANH